MRNKIQKSMMFVISSTLLITFAIMMTLFYFNSLKAMKKELKQETAYIQKALSISSNEYLEELDRTQIATRLTLIASSGAVLYDSKGEVHELENHGTREEVEAAFAFGKGEATRFSATIGKVTYYYAVLLDDGNVLRASKTLDYLVPITLRIIPVLGILLGILTVIAYFIAKYQTERLIQPINEMDLENPMGNEVYEELTPLLVNMENQRKAKEEVANMRKEFSANVSHELRTPLTSISGYAEIMKSGLVKSEDMTRFAEKIYHEASRLITLVEDIMKLSKLDEQKQSLEWENVNLYELCVEAKQRLSFTAEKQNVSVELQGESIEVSGVRRVLEEMIYNILENAIKYNVKNGYVNLWVGNSLEGAKIIVKDTGIGIPETETERIFERFYRVDKSHSKETGGTGLGLAIVKHGAILHEAEIRVESVLGSGTKIELIF